jgi:hypothetical protein
MFFKYLPSDLKTCLEKRDINGFLFDGQNYRLRSSVERISSSNCGIENKMCSGYQESDSSCYNQGQPKHQST